MTSILAGHFNIREIDSKRPAPDVDDVSKQQKQPEQGEGELRQGGIPTLEELRLCLCGSESSPVDGPAACPVAKVMRAIYYLRTMGSDEAIDILCNALHLKMYHSPLLRHEMGYVLGQMQSERACESLESVLLDSSDDVMVRHECAEALGAIGAARSVPLLERLADPSLMVRVPFGGKTCGGESESHVNPLGKNEDQKSCNENNESSDCCDSQDSKCRTRDGGRKARASSTPFQPTAIATHEPPEELRQTCEIARDFCRWKSGGSEGSAPAVACACMLSPYSTYDPAPPSPETDLLSTRDLGDVLINPSLQLFERYRAMFALRNRGGEESVLQLGRALVEDETSALLRHEVAYVLGQMQHPAAIEPLAESLRRKEEHSMVRHEAAEALGAIEGDIEQMERCFALMREFSDPEKESDQCVRESCEVALDAADYWKEYSS